jgi:hypothetical protein
MVLIRAPVGYHSADRGEVPMDDDLNRIGTP